MIIRLCTCVEAVFIYKTTQYREQEHVNLGARYQVYITTLLHYSSVVQHSRASTTTQFRSKVIGSLHKTGFIYNYSGLQLHALVFSPADNDYIYCSYCTQMNATQYTTYKTMGVSINSALVTIGVSTHNI